MDTNNKKNWGWIRLCRGNDILVLPAFCILIRHSFKNASKHAMKILLSVKIDCLVVW